MPAFGDLADITGRQMEWWSQELQGCVWGLWEGTRIEPFFPQYSTNTFRMCGMVVDSVIRTDKGQKGRSTTWKKKSRTSIWKDVRRWMALAVILTI